jgi:dTDP-4-amino-4,6-dideoxygalactose transaminase
VNAKLKKEIPILDLHAQYRVIGREIEEAVIAVLKSQQYILGPEVKELEKEIAAYCESKYAIGCASGSDAILLAMMAYAIGEGDEVITTPYTFFATAGAVARLGAKPVFVDIEEETFNMDVSQLEAAITPRTKAIMPIHLFGQCASMDEINEIAGRSKIPVIEDAAQAIGAEYRGRRAGSLGDVAAFSFYPSKNLGGAGDGGMLTTNDGAVAEKLLALRAHGAKKKYYHDYVGVNSRLDSLQAAILRVKVRYLDSWSNKRRANAELYERYFAESGLVEQGLVKLPKASPQMRHVYNQYVICVPRRDELKVWLKEQGIGTEIYYPLSLHEQICFSYLGYETGDFPVSEKAAQSSLAIPIFPELSEEDRQQIVALITEFYRQTSLRSLSSGEN